MAGVLCALCVGGCTPEEREGWVDPKKANIDPTLKRTRDDYANVTNPDYDANTQFKAKDSDPPIPDIAEILAAPKPPKIGETQLVSLAVTDDVPLKDVLIELARLADVDIEIDAGIQGGVSFRAKERPFNEVIERVSDLAGLRYSMKGGVLRVERDSPFVEIYHTDFLNIDRATSSSVSISTNVLSSAGGSTGGSGGGLNTGSNASISSKTEGDFWKQFEAGIKQILDYKPVSRLSQGASGGDANSAAAAVPEGAVTSGNGFYILNRQAATLTVSATERQHRLLKEFLSKMEASASAQVLIEAKIVEVKLNEIYQRGINWSKLGGNRINFVNRFGSVDNIANAATFAFAKASTGLDIDLDLAVQLTETFGTTRTLSSPRLHAINNQQAVLTFAQNQVYFQLKVQRDQTNTGASASTLLTVNSEIKTVPIGIILTLQPSINMDTQEITLNVRPTLSRVTGFVSDPAVAFLLTQVTTQQNIESRVPVVEVRELDSILKLKSGQVMVIGGLMEDKATNNEVGVPGASKVPVFGNLFKSADNNDAVSELVIFIRATIVDSRGNAQDADKVLYEKFTKDPRPLAF